MAGSSPDSFVGMHELSLGECQSVVSHVPFFPGSQLVEPPGHGAPMLQTPGAVHAHAMTGRSPVGLLPLHPMGAGMGAPLGWVSAEAGLASVSDAKATERQKRMGRMAGNSRVSDAVQATTASRGRSTRGKIQETRMTA